MYASNFAQFMINDEWQPPLPDQYIDSRYYILRGPILVEHILDIWLCDPYSSLTNNFIGVGVSKREALKDTVFKDQDTEPAASRV